ncbi:hypothetical protein BST61_g577 [Cercospora zeina]
MHPSHDQAAYGDVAFEPHADFAFDDTSHEEYKNMQRDIASLHMFNTTHLADQAFASIHDTPRDPTPHIHPEALDNGVFFEQNSTSWPKVQSSPTFHAQSLQSEFLNGRASSVSQHFGQITPPDDKPPKDFPAASRRPAEPTTNTEPPLSAKSERARNAANQRHAKAKRAKKESAKGTKSQSGNEDDRDEDGEVDGKREKYREKNRLAAAKCRAKKKTHTEDLEESARHITATNNRLRAEERELRDLFSSLRHQALAHDPTQGCNCAAIHMYNHNKAQEAARTAAMGLVGMGMPIQGLPSPSIGSDMSGMNSPPFASQPASRAQSSSTGHAGHHTRAQSFSGQLGFLPPRTASDMRRASHGPSCIASPTGSGDDLHDDFPGDSMDMR